MELWIVQLNQAIRMTHFHVTNSYKYAQSLQLIHCPQILTQRRNTFCWWAEMSQLLARNSVSFHPPPPFRDPTVFHHSMRPDFLPAWRTFGSSTGDVRLFYVQLESLVCVWFVWGDRGIWNAVLSLDRNRGADRVECLFSYRKNGEQEIGIQKINV